MRSQGRPRWWRLAAAFLLAVGFAAASRVCAQESPSLPEMMDDAELTDVFFLDSDQGWAVGDRGVVLHTEDGGRRWQAQTVPVGYRLESVHFVDGQRGWAVGGWVHAYTHNSSCVVLRTEDGGRRWTRVPGLTLPGLKHVRFFNASQGWAVGDGSSLYPTGVFRTEDGGRSWVTVPAGARGQWLAADFRDTRQGVLAGHNGAVAHVSSMRVVASQPPEIGLRPLRGVVFANERHGWLAGDGGLMLQTTDGGLTWQAPPGPLPADVVRLFDFRDLAVVGDNIWAAGAPGSRVLHSADGGRTWRMLRTDLNVPLRSLAFVDEQRGWAVGALGTILSTRDGGQTWRRQRGLGTRAALLGLFSEPARIPMELFALKSGSEGYFGFVELLTRRDVELPLPGGAPLEDRSLAAMSAVGASGAEQAWCFPLRQAGLGLSSASIVAAWDRAHGGNAAELLKERVVRKIRQWRPEVIVTDPPCPRGSEPLAHMINQIVLSAASEAADPASHTEHATVAGLEPWRVKKVYSVAEAAEYATAKLTTAQLAPRLGRSIGDQADDGYAMVLSQSPRLPLTVGFQLLLNDLPQQAGRDDFFSGIFLQVGGEARRELQEPVGSNMDELNRIAQKRRNIQALLESSAESSAKMAVWLGQARDLIDGMDDANAGHVLHQLAQRYCAAGQFELAAQSFQLLAEQFPRHRLSESAFAWLIQYYASGEIAWQLRRGTRFQTQQAVAHVVDSSAAKTDGPLLDEEHPEGRPAAATAVRTGFETFGNTTTAGVGLGAADRAALAIAIARLVPQSRPELAAEPKVQFPASVAYRNAGQPQEAERFYHRLSGGQTAAEWANCARAELWLTPRRGAAPKPSYSCQPTAARPTLDGKLDDPVWQSAAPMRLASARRDDDSWPAAVMLSRDDEFLFLAISCRKAPGCVYPEVPAGPRPRDPDLQTHDRVDVWIDVDRDYTSFYRLTVDHRGWTGESCLGDVGWNPEWYVAAESAGDEWRVEAAIPWREIVPTRPESADVWIVGVQRIVPGVGIQGFTSPPAVDIVPETFALLAFQ